MLHDTRYDKKIPQDRTITCTRVVVEYKPQKTDPNRVQITVGGNLADYPEELTTRTADLIITKIMWNSVLSTPGAKYMCTDVKNMYLATPMECYKYMQMKIEIIPQEFMDTYQLHDKVKDGYIYIQIENSMYGLPQAGILANKLLQKRLAPYWYYKVPHTPGLWKHVYNPIQFTLVVNDFER